MLGSRFFRFSEKIHEDGHQVLSIDAVESSCGACSLSELCDSICADGWTSNGKGNWLSSRPVCGSLLKLQLSSDLSGVILGEGTGKIMV